tara:strand:- start:10476 stop:12140 length:1665 start_codon:yes stop_codon:yes gene_type:complete
VSFKFIFFLSIIFISLSSSSSFHFNKFLPNKKKDQIAMGYVYNDVNENLSMDKNEIGISGVYVSNGVEIVKTDKDGKYKIPVSDDAIIFVIKPRNWMTPINNLNLPQFYYIHKPNGSPSNFTFKGVDPTGPLPRNINFPLYAENGKSNFKMIVFGDPQPYSLEEVDFFSENIVSELVAVKGVEFGMTMGDIVGDNLDLLEPINQAVSKIGIPWYNVLGNHDVNFQADRDELSDETFERIYGPPNYAFVYGDVHFIVVDNVIMNDPVGDRGYVGGLRPDQIEFVKNYLELVSRDDLIVLTMHIPLVQHERFRESDQKELFSLLSEFPNTLSISAHSHTQNNTFFHEESSHWQGEVPHHHFNVGTTSGNWWNGVRDENDIPLTMMRDGTPNGYSYITFNGTKYIIDWKVSGKPEDYRMNIHTPRGVKEGESSSTPITVNFFNGSEQSELSFRVLGETEWAKMDQVSQQDPFYSLIYERFNDYNSLKIKESWENDPQLKDKSYPLIKRMYEANKSTHLWQSKIGASLPEGVHIIEVMVKDRYDREFKDYHSIRIVKD